jgi:hypothetical protein
MTNKGKKLEPPLKLDMSFSEALSRFAATDPGEVEENIERSKTKRPPQDGTPRRPARQEQRDKPPEDRSRKPS